MQAGWQAGAGRVWVLAGLSLATASYLGSQLCGGAGAGLREQLLHATAALASLAYPAIPLTSAILTVNFLRAGADPKAFSEQFTKVNPFAKVRQDKFILNLSQNIVQLVLYLLLVPLFLVNALDRRLDWNQDWLQQLPLMLVTSFAALAILTKLRLTRNSVEDLKVTDYLEIN